MLIRCRRQLLSNRSLQDAQCHYARGWSAHPLGNRRGRLATLARSCTKIGGSCVVAREEFYE